MENVSDYYIVMVDTLLSDLGSSTKEGRFTATISEDPKEELVIDGASTPKAKEMIKGILDAGAKATGATVISEEGCVDGGDPAIYGDDVVEAIDGGSILLGNPTSDDRMKFLLDHNLIMLKTNYDAFMKASVGMPHPAMEDGAVEMGAPILPGSMREPAEQLASQLADHIVTLIASMIPGGMFMQGIIKTLIHSAAVVNGAQKLEDMIFEKVEMDARIALG